MYFTKKGEVLRMDRLIGSVPADPNVTKLQDIPGGLSMEALYKLSADPEFAKLLPHMAVPTPHEADESAPGEIVAGLGAVVVHHLTYSMYVSLGRVAYKIWRSVLSR